MNTSHLTEYVTEDERQALMVLDMIEPQDGYQRVFAITFGILAAS